MTTGTYDSELQQTESPPLLEVEALNKVYPIRAGMLHRLKGQVYAVDDVTFSVREGETLSLVGESGCGKTTLARCILRAIDPTSGEIRFRTRTGTTVDLASLNEKELRPIWREIQMVFQDPYSSLNPRMTIFQTVGEPLLLQGMKDTEQRRTRVGELLELVGLSKRYMGRYPHAFSGGQRQRIGIARAVALNPRLVVADEPVSALDVSVQAQTLNLFLDLQESLRLTYIFVAHDLSVVKHITDRVAVMYVGQMVELGTRDDVFSRPKHPYTEALLASVPKPDPRERSTRIPLRGEVANPASPPTGCYFHPRCEYAVDRCRTESPPLQEVAPGWQVRCHRVSELSLKGITIRKPATIDPDA